MTEDSRMTRCPRGAPAYGKRSPPAPGWRSEPQHRVALGDRGRVDTRVDVVLDPLCRAAGGLVGAGAVVADGDRRTAVADAERRVAHEPGDAADQLADVALLALHRREQLVRALPVVPADDGVHMRAPQVGVGAVTLPRVA